MPHGERVILSDTVGFISDLPTTLIAAFRATLEEVIEADLILHVRDVSHEDTDAQSSDVAKVLGELGIASVQTRACWKCGTRSIDWAPRRASVLRISLSGASTAAVLVSAADRRRH